MSIKIDVKGLAKCLWKPAVCIVLIVWEFLATMWLIVHGAAIFGGWSVSAWLVYAVAIPLLIFVIIFMCFILVYTAHWGFPD